MANTAGRRERRSALSRIGETYGSLTVLDIVRTDKGRAICYAKCACGSEKEYLLQGLVSGTTKSCGCLSSSSKRRTSESRIGETINNMTLLEVVGRSNRGDAIGRFKCEHCGSEHKESLIDSWKSNKLKSCGCQVTRTRTKPEDQIGIQYNHLTLIKITGKQGGRKTGLFHCSNCGKDKDGIPITKVVNGETKSCGCLNSKAEDEIGTVWGDLKLLEVTQKANRRDVTKTKGMFECLLCSSHKEIDVYQVKGGRQTDCGCSKFHGFSDHKSYGVYKGMFDRCTNPLHKNYPKWGGRGITVCSRWLEPNGVGLQAFMDDMGNDRPSMKHSLHRMWLYNDQNKLEECMEYGPDTCKWATSRQQNIEKRSPKLKKKVSEFEKLLDKGLTVEEIAIELNIKVQKCAFFLSTLGLLEGYQYQEGEN